MLQDVAVVHVHARIWRELHGHLHLFSRPDQDGILPPAVDQALLGGIVAGRVGGRRPLDHLELDIVDMHGVWDG